MPGDFFFYGNDGNESIYVHVVLIVAIGGIGVIGDI